MSFPLGEVASLAAALCWAVGLNLFSRDVRGIGPRPVNLFKGMIGSTMVVVCLAVVGWRPAPLRDQAFVALSGVVGLAVGDSLLFTALRTLGAHRTALFAGLGPVLTAIGGALFLGEFLGGQQLAGVLAATAGVALVVHFRPHGEEPSVTGRGLLLAGAAALCQASGTLLAKRGLQGEMEVLPSTAIRILAGTAMLALFGLFRGDLGPDLKRLVERGPLLRLIRAAFIGTFLGIGLMQLGIAHTESAVASALHSTTPLFTLPIAIVVLRERVGGGAILGSLLAVGGIVTLLLG